MKVLILIVILILVVIIFMANRKMCSKLCVEKYESIVTDNLNGKGYAISSWNLKDNMKKVGDCYTKSVKNCLNYSNCGICNNKCIPGDDDGPYYKTGCKTWSIADSRTGEEHVVRPFDVYLSSYSQIPLSVQVGI
jgi:hypothetical protein